jgi:hypothetical protein
VDAKLAGVGLPKNAGTSSTLFSQKNYWLCQKVEFGEKGVYQGWVFRNLSMQSVMQGFAGPVF